MTTFKLTRNPEMPTQVGFVKVTPASRTINYVDELIDELAKLQKAAVAIKRDAQSDKDCNHSMELINAIALVKLAIAEL